MYDEKLLSDVYYFTDKKCEENKVKNCTIRNEFVFGRTNFYLCSKNIFYYVCVSKDGNMYSVWSHKIKGDSAEYTPSEIMSLFRKGYTKHNITNEMVDLFLNEPAKYKKKFIRKSNKGK